MCRSITLYRMGIRKQVKGKLLWQWECGNLLYTCKCFFFFFFCRAAFSCHVTGDDADAYLQTRPWIFPSRRVKTPNSHWNPRHPAEIGVRRCASPAPGRDRSCSTPLRCWTTNGGCPAQHRASASETASARWAALRRVNWKERWHLRQDLLSSQCIAWPSPHRLHWQGWSM